MRGGAKGVRAAVDTSGTNVGRLGEQRHLSIRRFRSTAPGSSIAKSGQTLLRLARQNRPRLSSAAKDGIQLNEEEMPAALKLDGAQLRDIEESR